MKTLLPVVAALISVGAVQAATVIAVESGGISINSQNTGAVGSSADPWLVNETMTSGGTLVFRASDPAQAVGPGNTSGSFHATGRWIRKTVLNNTGVTWLSFELELQEILGTPSGQGDGLSFADDDPIRLLFSSDRFATYTRIDTTRDYLNFSRGVVNPGESVSFLFAITDNSPTSPIYLVQTPNLSDVPEPASMLLVGCGLGLALFVRRRRTA